MLRIIRILAVAALIALGVATAIKAKAGPIIVTATPVTEAAPQTPVERVRHTRHAPRVEREKPVEHDKPKHEDEKAARLKTPWSLPVSCTTAKWYMNHFSVETLETMRKAAGKPAPTALQKQQARDCLAGLRPND